MRRMCALISADTLPSLTTLRTLWDVLAWAGPSSRALAAPHAQLRAGAAESDATSAAAAAGSCECGMGGIGAVAGAVGETQHLAASGAALGGGGAQAPSGDACGQNRIGGGSSSSTSASAGPTMAGAMQREKAPSEQLPSQPGTAAARGSCPVLAPLPAGPLHPLDCHMFLVRELAGRKLTQVAHALAGEGGD